MKLFTGGKKTSIIIILIVCFVGTGIAAVKNMMAKNSVTTMVIATNMTEKLISKVTIIVTSKPGANIYLLKKQHDGNFIPIRMKVQKDIPIAFYVNLGTYKILGKLYDHIPDPYCSSELELNTPEGIIYENIEFKKLTYDGPCIETIQIH